MADAVNFPGSNIVMSAPVGAENVSDLHAFTNGVCCVSCWHLTADEIAEITKTGQVYVSVFMGGGMPPIFVGSETEVRNIVADYGVWRRD